MYIYVYVHVHCMLYVCHTVTYNVSHIHVHSITHIPGSHHVLVLAAVCLQIGLGLPLGAHGAQEGVLGLAVSEGGKKRREIVCGVCVCVCVCVWIMNILSHTYRQQMKERT
jgi:hypothetical protein